MASWESRTRPGNREGGASKLRPFLFSSPAPADSSASASWERPLSDMYIAQRVRAGDVSSPAIHQPPAVCGQSKIWNRIARPRTGELVLPLKRVENVIGQWIVKAWQNFDLPRRETKPSRFLPFSTQSPHLADPLLSPPQN